MWKHFIWNNDAHITSVRLVKRALKINPLPSQTEADCEDTVMITPVKNNPVPAKINLNNNK